MTLTSLKSVEGTWVDFSDQMITLKVDNQPRSIERSSVSRVSLRENPKRLRSTLLGLAIGKTLPPDVVHSVWVRGDIHPSAVG